MSACASSASVSRKPVPWVHSQHLLQDLCELNAKTNMNQTALHLAVHQGSTKIVERLVGYGADLNVPDSDGDTLLHIALAKDTVDTLSADTPQLKKVCTY